ncbi:MAG: tRNA 2-thiouridine(34) synthase MnmA [Flavobacteriales bacterium]|jgi:tRNA-specific 2-thiouridylase
MSKRVVVGLSGGVDSSVTAHLLLEQGYEVIGIFMRNWHDESVTINNECPWIDDSNDAMLVAEHLGIPFHVLDLSKDYKQRIVDYMFREYQMGRTPNPDVLCNREIKFDIFLKAALNLKADFVATGHYCQKRSFFDSDGKEIYQLIAGADPNKDQSYFLCQLSQQQLSKALFPIGHLQKSQVREIAREIGLPTAEKKDSQGLCFIGKVKLPTFLQQQLEPKHGVVLEVPPLEKYRAPEIAATTVENIEKIVAPPTIYLEEGKEVGKHQGAHYYTVGQRKGLGVGGKAEPLFIVKTDTSNNVVFTGQGETHPALLRRGLFVEKTDIHWIREDLTLNEGERKRYAGRIRYRQELVGCELIMGECGLYIIFDELQKGIAAGQFVAWYEGDELIGSGVIG